jgi:hypothetical protein
VAECKWVSPDQLRREFDRARTEPAHLTPWFQMIAEQLLFAWWEDGALARILSARGLGAEMRDRVPAILSLPGQPDTCIPASTPV